MTRLEDLHEAWTDDVIPVTERAERGGTPLQHQWRDNGIVILPKFIPGGLIDAYADEWQEVHGKFDEEGCQKGGWQDCTPYMRYPALRSLVCAKEIAEVLEELTLEAMGTHLNLTGWVSTERDWHADQYLNEPHVGGYYAAVWIALDDVHPDSGPFQWVPDSHHWEPISQARIIKAIGTTRENSMWPKDSERILTPLYEEKIATEELEVKSFLGKRGDLLIWHGRLLHRGSRPKVPGMERRALIAHFSGIHHRRDMPTAKRADEGGWYFPLGSQPF